jgi:hypothetical protein
MYWKNGNQCAWQPVSVAANISLKSLRSTSKVNLRISTVPSQGGSHLNTNDPVANPTIVSYNARDVKNNNTKIPQCFFPRKIFSIYRRNSLDPRLCCR